VEAGSGLLSVTREQDSSPTNLGHHRVFQKRTQIAQITLMAQRGSDRSRSSICVICEISAICVGFWNSRDA
jgi:hypothetical protein